MNDVHGTRPRERDGVSDARSAAIGEPGFTRRVLIVTGVVVLVVAAAAIFAAAYDAVFLFFLAVLIAILLRAASVAVGWWTKLGPGWSLTLVVAVLLALLAAGGYAVGSMAAGQFDRLATDLP